MKKTIGQWKAMKPLAMYEGSKAALFYALQDAREDILALSELLRKAAYPRRGTPEETMDIQQFSDMVQEALPISTFEE